MGAERAVASVKGAPDAPTPNPSPEGDDGINRPHVVAIDYGAKRQHILRHLVNRAARKGDGAAGER